MLLTVVLTVALLAPVGLSVWLVAHRGFGVRIVAFTLTLALGVELAVQLWAAGLLNVGTVALTVAVCGTTYGGWWLSRGLIDRILDQGGMDARW